MLSTSAGASDRTGSEVLTSPCNDSNIVFAHDQRFSHDVPCSRNRDCRAWWGSIQGSLDAASVSRPDFGAMTTFIFTTVPADSSDHAGESNHCRSQPGHCSNARRIKREILKGLIVESS